VPTTPLVVAERLIEIIEQDHELYQVDAVAIIEREFGSGFIRKSSSDGSSIDGRVRRAMYVFSDEFEWIPADKLWRIKN
jgi:hypothetical protein